MPGFGEMYVDQIRPAHVHAWRVGISQLIAAGTYSPVTANGWLAILHVILKAAKRDFELSSDPMSLGARKRADPVKIAGHPQISSPNEIRRRSGVVR